MTTYRIDKTGGNGQSVQVGRQYANNLQVQVFDIDTIPNTPITNGSVQFQNTNNLVTQPAATFAGGAGSENQQLGAGGYATSSRPTANSVAGKVSIRCWIGGAQTIFTLTNKTPSGAPAANGLGTGTGSGQVLLQGGGPGVPITAIVTDQFDNPFPGASVTFQLPSTGASGTFTVGGGLTATATSDASGIATCPAFTANSQLGPWQLTAFVTADNTLAVTYDLNTNPSSGTEVCTAVLVPTTYATFPRAGSTTTWINPANWGLNANATNFFGTTAFGEFSQYIIASGFGASLAAIPDAAEITRITYTQQARNNTVAASQLRIWPENVGFASPQLATQATYNPPTNNTFAVNTANWTTFTTPNPGSKLLGADVKSANFRIVQYNTFTGGVLASGQCDVKLLGITICYIVAAAGGADPATHVCEV
jgi:hypothetical protein